MTFAAAIWAGCLAAAGAPPPGDPLFDLVRLAEAVQVGDVDAAEALKARLVKNPSGPISPPIGLRAAEEEAQRARAPVLPALPGRLSEADAEEEAARSLQAGEAKRALEALRAAGPEDRWPPRLEMLAARADHTLGDEAAARARWLLVAESRDRQLAAEAAIAWARSAEAAGDLEGALHRLAGVVRDPHHGAEAAYLAGRLQLQHGRTGEAIDRLALAASKRRQRFSDEACWWLGWAYFGQNQIEGHFDQAARQWAALEKGWPRSPLLAQALYWRARALDEVGNGGESAAIRNRLPVVAPGSYYAVLADRAIPRAGAGTPERCDPAGIDPSAPFWVAYRRAALLHGLGLSSLAAGELEVASRKARGPAEAWAMAQLDSALGETGRAFSRANGSAGSCIPSSWPSAPLYPRVAPSEVAWAARAASIDPFWVDALMRRESRFEASARSPAGAVGLLQMLPVTGARIASIAGVAPPDLSAPVENIWFGAWYLGALSERFGGVFPLVAAAYDAGPSSVAGWLSGDRRLDEFVEQIPFRETRAYVKEAIANLAAYQALYGAADLKVSAASKIGGAPASVGVSF